MSAVKIATDVAKKLVAEEAVNKWFKNLKNDRLYNIGIGSGSTIVFAVKKLSKIVEENNLQVACVPSSFQARQLITENGLNLSNLEVTPALDIVIDGADEVDDDFQLIKGGGGCLLQEKILIHYSKIRLIVVDYTKISKKLGDKWKKGVPIEVVPDAVVPVSKEIERILGGKVELRMAVKKAGPVVTDNGNFLIDWKFTGEHNWPDVNSRLVNIPGIVETGLFINYCPIVYVGNENGFVDELSLDNKPVTYNL